MHDEGKKMEEIRVDYLVKYTGVSTPDMKTVKFINASQNGMMRKNSCMI